MLQAFVITLREGLEAFLIVAISLAYLKKTGRHGLIPAVHWGIGVSVLVSIAAGVAFARASNQALWEGILASGAAAFLGVFGFTLLMITREGMETALLMNALIFQVKSAQIIGGAVAGTALS